MKNTISEIQSLASSLDSASDKEKQCADIIHSCYTLIRKIQDSKKSNKSYWIGLFDRHPDSDYEVGFDIVTLGFCEKSTALRRLSEYAGYKKTREESSGFYVKEVSEDAYLKYFILSDYKKAWAAMMGHSEEAEKIAEMIRKLIKPLTQELCLNPADVIFKLYYKN